MGIGNDKGMLFTEGQYLSKAEIAAHYNLSDVDGIWDQVLAYRRFFRVELPLVASNGNRYSLVLSRLPLLRLYGTEKRLLSDLTRTLFLSKPALGGFLEKCRERDIGFLFGVLDIPYDPKAVKDLAQEVGLTDPQYGAVQTYLKAKKILSGSFMGGFDVSLSQRINADLQGLAPGSEDGEGAKANGLGGAFAVWNAESDIPSLGKALIGLFECLRQHPFPYFGAETYALLTAMAMAKDSHCRLPFALNLLPLAYLTDSKAKASFELSQKSGDLTYFVLAALDGLNQAADGLESDLFEAEKQTLADSGTGEASEAKADVVPVSPVSGAKKETEKAEAVKKSPLDLAIESLMESHPVLRKTQAHFWLTHQSIGKFYTVAQFKAEEGTAYETARTSMELLASLGFYAKGKVGKKFTYTPKPQPESIGSTKTKEPSDHGDSH